MAGRRRGPAIGSAAPLTAPSRILILAPHPDDEIVACGITAFRAHHAGAEIHALYLTTGVPPRDRVWRWDRLRYDARLARRRAEAEAAAALMALNPLAFLDIPSRCLRTQLDAAAAAVERALGETAADCLWVTAFEGAHQDHDAANALAARFAGRLPVWEFAAYNYAGGRVCANRFADARGGVVELHLNDQEQALKRHALARYASERGNLAHVGTMQEAYRPLPRHDYAAPPHAGTLFRERFHWVPFRHPRIDFTPSADVYATLGRWVQAGAAARRLTSSPASNGDGGDTAGGAP
ncbi:MAG TPA: PIG-L family deacetylase [Stellaceae bacterium]|nr:PIG-L family deacetylase [Stellaceae bacterium]